MEDSRGALNESQPDGNSRVVALANLARLFNLVLCCTRLTITDRKRQTDRDRGGEGGSLLWGKMENGSGVKMRNTD